MTVSSVSPFNSLSDLLNCATGGGTGPAQNVFFFRDGTIGNKATPVATIAGHITDMYQWNGYPNCNSDTIPSASWANCHRLDSGSLSFNPPAVGALWLQGLVLTSTGNGMGFLYDRLGNNGTLSATTITPQSVSSSIDRYTGSACIGNSIWVEIYTQIGATPSFINATYINQSGLTSVTPSASFGGTGFREANRIIHLQLAPGDTGVQAVNSVIVNVTTGTAGSFGVTIAHPICTIPFDVASSQLGLRNLLFDIPAIPQIQPQACLAFAWIANTATTGQRLFGTLHLVEK